MLLLCDVRTAAAECLWRCCFAAAGGWSSVSSAWCFSVQCHHQQHHQWQRRQWQQ